MQKWIENSRSQVIITKIGFNYFMSHDQYFMWLSIIKQDDSFNNEKTGIQCILPQQKRHLVAIFILLAAIFMAVRLLVSHVLALDSIFSSLKLRLSTYFKLIQIRVT